MVTYTHIECSEVLFFSNSYVVYLFISTAYGKIDADDMLVAWENDGKGHILKCLNYSLLPWSNQPLRLSYPLLSPASLVLIDKSIRVFWRRPLLYPMTFLVYASCQSQP